MNRIHVRRCSMSSIEEEDESTASDEPTTQIEQSSSLSQEQQQQSPVMHSPSVLEWDSEISESEQEFDDNNENSNDNTEEQAANRALQNFIQSHSRTRQTSLNNNNDSYSPFSIQLYDEEDSSEFDVIMSELRDFKNEFEENSNLSKSLKLSSSIISPKSSSSFSTSGCVYELRTLENQLEAALASLTLTINDSTITNHDSQQRSSDSSACSSGLGDEIVNDSFHYYPNQHNVSLASKITTTTTDDCDSAFSDSGSTDKIILPNHDDLFFSSSSPSSSSQSQNSSKILIRTYNDDGSTKSIFINDSMLIRDVLFVLIHKNHREVDINYTLIEILPDLHMERIFEDHQKLTEAILMWPTISSNRLSFTKRSEKYSFFQTRNSDEEFFHTPDIEGNIYLKEKSRKSWKKFFCVLRSSGLYFIPKGKSKKDLICLAKFENVELFFGFDWKKKFKSPSDFCFALKHPLIQKKSSKYIKYMCVETKNEFDRWIQNIRIAKFGQQLKINYLLMDKAINMYRLSGRFTPQPEQSINVIPNHDCQTPILPNQYYTIDCSMDENSPIKSASYMDELRQRLERVLNESPEENQSNTKLKLISTPKTIGSTPLPRKQIQSFGNLSYRTMNTIKHYPQEQQMSKSFIISSKQEVHRSASSLSITSKSDFDEIDFSISSSIFLNTNKKLTNPIKSKPSSNIQLPKSSLSIKNNLISPSLKLPIPIQTKPILNRSFNSSNNKLVPPVPPRKSSISRPLLKPSPPQRNSSTNLLLRKSHISHL